MGPNPTRRPLRDLIDSDAPVPPRRAASVMVAVARHLEGVEASGIDAGPVRPEQVLLGADGSTDITLDDGGRGALPASTPDAPPIGTESGAAIGKLLFEVLTGRPPLGREDAFEPAVVSGLSPTVCALMARSLSDAPGQWPDARTWRAALEAQTGGLAPPVAPAVRAARRRRRVLVAIGMALLVGATVLTLVLAPSWWDSVNEGSLGADHAAVQASRTSS